MDLFDPFNPYEELQLFAAGWGPDYLDPFNMLNPLVNPISFSNAAQINDTTLNNLMELALNTTDDSERNIIYKNIQSYMAEEGFFHAYLYHPKIYFVHSADLYGVTYNAMGKFQAYGIRKG
jgi:ABC-type transport system substrate-binding protein